MIGQLLTDLKQWAEQTVTVQGYIGVLLLMLLSSMNVPVASSLVLALGGLLAAGGKLNVGLVVVAGAFGDLVGCATSYGLGNALGRPLALKYGRYVRLNEKELARAERWFERFGERAFLVGRIVPVVRSFISLPAGVCKAPLGKFLLYSALGAVIYAVLWTSIGYMVGENWALVEQNLSIFNYLAIAAIGFFIVRFVLRWRRRRAVNT